MDRGLAYGEACFETFRVIDGHIFDWPGHWQRLVGGLEEFGVSLPAGLDQTVCHACLQAAANVAADALIRLTISSGDAGWGLTNRGGEPVAHIQCMAYTIHASPLLLRLASWPFALQSKQAKFVSDYADTLRALRGVDANVLFEQGGMLLATATANVLLYRHGVWHTPPATAGVLPGRVREFLMRQGVLCVSPCPVAWLDDCDAMAVCNSGVFMRAVGQVEPVERAKAMDACHPAFNVLTDALRAAEGTRL